MTWKTYPWRLVGFNALITIGTLAVLEIWRPYFFLTDDNLSSTLPFFTEVGRHLGHGESPFVSQYIFNGNYNLLRDISYLTWHPLYLLTSLCANLPAPFRYSIVDINSWILFVLTTTGFTALALYLRKIYDLELTDGQITFFATSYTWSLFALVVSSSWFTFTGSISALPWIALGVFQQRPRIGLLITTLATLHAVLGGHSEPLITSTLTFTFLVGGICLSRHSLKPLWVWAGSNLIALVLLLPFLVPAFDGFSSAVRSQGLPATDLSTFNIPAWRLVAGYLLGPWAYSLGIPPVPFTGVKFYLAGLTGCLASWCLLPPLLRKTPWTTLQVTCVAIILFLVLLIARPLWLSEIMFQVPLLNSLRWPFRDTLQFIFFIHLFLLLRSRIPTKLDTSFAGIGTLIFILGVFPFWADPPTLNPLLLDRKFILSGLSEKHWSHVKELLDPSAPVLSATTPELAISPELPFSLIGSLNYGQLFAVKNYYGYSSTAPSDQIPLFFHVTFKFRDKYVTSDKALFTPKSIRNIYESHPDQKFNIITLEGMDPLHIILTRPDGSVIDITPE